MVGAFLTFEHIQIMTVETTIECECVNGKTIDELQNQIQRRNKILHESTEKAVTAMAINAIKSLRAMTPKSNGKIVVKDSIQNNDLDICVVECPEYCIGYKSSKGHKEIKPCIRLKSSNEIVNLKVWWRTFTDKSIVHAKVFRVILSSGRKEAWHKKDAVWYMISYNIDQARKWIKARYDKIVKIYSGLGKDVWSRAMMLVSNRPAKFISSDKSKQVLNDNAIVTKRSSGGISSGEYSVTISDTLRFADKIVPENAVNTAMMKAINSSNGYINNYLQKAKDGNWFEEIKEAPFPPEAFNGD